MTTADQCLPEILPINSHLGSSSVLAGISSRFASSQSGLRRIKVNAVFILVALAFLSIILEFHDGMKNVQSLPSPQPFHGNCRHSPWSALCSCARVPKAAAPAGKRPWSKPRLALVEMDFTLTGGSMSPESQLEADITTYQMGFQLRGTGRFPEAPPGAHWRIPPLQRQQSAQL